jgi:hypothetical protein
MARDWTRTLVCLWVLWQSFYAGQGGLKFVKLMGPVSSTACLSELAVKVPYEKKVGLMRGYADVTKEARVDHPSGLWYVCFPEGHDPRDT